MKKILVLTALVTLISVHSRAQFVFPGMMGGDSSDLVSQIMGTDTPDLKKTEPADDAEAVKVEEKAEDPDEIAVKKMELEAQRLRLQQEIASLKGKGVLTKEEEEVLKLKNENLKIVALQERILLEQELQQMQKDRQSTNYPASGLYGHQFFRDGAFKIFEKTSEVVATENYVIGSGDVVQLEVWGFRYWSKSYTVSESGSIDISGYQKIFLKGLTLSQARNIIGSRLGLGGNESSYSVNVTRPRMVSVTVLGEVFRPGTYTLPATNSAFNVLASMGGPSDIGSVRNIYIKRDGKIRDSFDTYEYFGNVMHQRDVFLQNNDYIIVTPAAQVINVSGSVRRPGNYELKSGEGLLNLIQFAGGVYPNTYLNDVVISRIRNNVYEVLSVNLDSLKRLKKDFILNGGESVNFKSITSDNQFAVQIQGAVSVPGTYRIRPGMRISALIKNANGLTSDAYTERGYIIRTNKDFSKSYITFSPADVLQKKTPEADVVIEDRDSIFIFRSPDITQFNTVSISGAVYRPVTTRYIAGITLGELLFMTGGLKEDADLQKGFIIRTNSEYEKTLIPFEPGKVATRTGFHDFEILPKDEVTIYSKSDFLRKYRMSIQGAVKAAKDVEYNESTRIADLVNLAGGLESSAYTQRALVMREDIHTGIKSARTVNLEMALNNPESEANIKIEKNDVVRVFSLTELKTNFEVSIYGEVRKAGTYDYADNMSLQNLIDLAGGLEFIAAGTQIEIVRNLFLKDGTYQFLKPEIIVSRITDNLLLDSGFVRFNLQPFDKIFIRKNPNFIPMKMIYIDGAVMYPGYYALQGDNEKLNSIFKRAGGFRPDAMVHGITIKRIRPNGDTIEVIAHSRKAINRKRSHYNAIVRSGDKIVVPFSENLIYLNGDMNKFTTSDIGAYYKPGKRAKYYIRNFGGGFTRTSDKKNVVVVHANGARVGVHKYVLFKVYPKVKEGSKIVVNSKPAPTGRNRFDTDAFLNKLLTRTTAVLTLVGLYKIATAK